MLRIHRETEADFLVTWAYTEEGDIEPLYLAVHETCSTIPSMSTGIFIDHHSTDSTVATLKPSAAYALSAPSALRDAESQQFLRTCLRPWGGDALQPVLANRLQQRNYLVAGCFFPRA